MKRVFVLVNKRGQAAAELAILGALIITAFSYIMNFGQSLGATQQVKMEAFRRALQKAYVRNANVSFTLKKDVSAASATAGFWQGQGISPESSASVTWQKGQAGDPLTVNQSSFAFWQINDTEVKGSNPISSEHGLPLRLTDHYDATGAKADHQVYAPASVYKNNAQRTESYTFTGNKTEDNAGINYIKIAELQDSTSGDLYTHFNTAVDTDPGDDTTPTPTWATAEDISYSSSQSYDYNKDWSTSHD
jgi:hypothetical protein